MLAGSMKPENTWQEKSGERWAELQERTDVQLGDFGRAALARVSPVPGEKALDVGCGAGQSTLELAELVGPDGHVVGIDISEPLLARARERVTASGHDNVELTLGDAATARLTPPLFDLVFSRFGVMFFEDAVAAFTHLREAMRPWGRLGFVCWQAARLNPWAEAPMAAVRAVAPAQPLPPMFAQDQPGPFYFADPTFVRATLAAAGFTDVGLAPHEAQMSLGGARTLAEAVDFTAQIGPAARFIAEADPALKPRMTAALAEALGPYVTDAGVFVQAHAWLVTARAPGSGAGRSSA
jgi:SAM-dependent methyltransferase